MCLKYTRENWKVQWEIQRLKCAKCTLSNCFAFGTRVIRLMDLELSERRRFICVFAYDKIGKQIKCEGSENK